MREKLLSIGDDFWIEDDGGNRAYRVDGKAARLRETFGGNYPRLVQIKNQYDPANLFRLNANIKPSAPT